MKIEIPMLDFHGTQWPGWRLVPFPLAPDDAAAVLRVSLERRLTGLLRP